jgi:hypothetical protein
MKPSHDLTSDPRRALFNRFVLPALSRRSTYLIMAAAILLLDYFTGPYIQFPITFVLPVALAAWYCSFRYGLALAVLLPVGRFVIAVLVDRPSPLIYVAINAVIRISLLTFIGYLVSRTANQTRELAKEVKLLEGILPICSFCKKIRDEGRQWQPLETYISGRSEASFSHCICPECAEKHYGKYGIGR